MWDMRDEKAEREITVEERKSVEKVYTRHLCIRGVAA